MNTINTNIYSVIFITFVIIVYLDIYPINMRGFVNERYVQENLQIYDDDFKKGDQTLDTTVYIDIPKSDKQLSDSIDSYVFHKLPASIPGYDESIFLIMDLPPPSLIL